MRERRCYVDGAREEGAGATIVKVNPTSGTELGRFAAADAAQVERAVGAARRAFDSGPWREYDGARRGAILHRLVDLMEANLDALVEIVGAEVGSPVSLAVPLQLEGALFNLRWFADAAPLGPDGWYERGTTVDAPSGGTHPGLTSHGVIVREPAGVAAAITAYNFPYNLLGWKLGAALAAGCTVVLQPSARATISTLALWSLIEQLELPPGVVNLVLGEAEVGQALTGDPRVDLVSFTGSEAVGSRIMVQAAPTIKKVILELGGKSPNILLPGTDVEAAIAPSMLRLITNAGQRCGATSRMLVPRADYARFCAAAAEFLDQVAVGDPRDPATVVGPLVDKAHLEFVAGHVERALAGGAEIVAGGGAPPAEFPDGAFMRPALLGSLTNADAFAQEEQFGPVGSVLPYDDVEEAIAIANDSLYGLNANVFGPLPDALAVARRIRSGNVTINGGGRIRPEAPWGGYGRSGIGRESGDEGFREYFEVKHIQWPLT
ncbi:MAG: aldehyde dehydrogenase family protein [Actinobacteria bacterium]|nr:aldehyde dehydrogenase family protein [Actinomycetota bacterium]